MTVMNVRYLHVRLLVTALAVCFLLLPAARATAAAGDAAPTDAEEARAFHERAKAAFALSHYAQAAEFFEKAFELKSDPALLYNAAQSHRLAGNKQRALTLYQNYLRVYGRDDRRAQIDQRIEELKRAIEHDRTEVPVPPPAGWPPGTPAAKTSAGVAASPHAAEPARPLPPTALTPAPPAAAAPAKPAPARPAPPASAFVGPMPAPAPAPSPPPVSLPTPPPAIEPISTGSSSASPMLLTQSNAPAHADDRSLTQKPWFWIAVGGGVAAAATVVLLLVLGGSKDPTASIGHVPGN
jgi:hypothetical protein